MYVFPCRKMHLFKNRKSEPEFFITVKYRDPLPAHQVVTLSLYFHLTDWLIQWCLFPEKAHDLEQLLGEPFVPALVHANSLGLVYDFLIDSSASLSAELPAVVKKKNNVRRLELHIQGSKNFILVCLIMSLKNQCYQISFPELLQ